MSKPSKTCTGLLTLLLTQALSATAQPADAVTPDIPGVTAPGAPIEQLASGREGSEGPLGLPDGSLLFTETRAQRVLRIAPDKEVSVFLERTDGVNALALAPNGDLVAVVQQDPPRVGIVHPADHKRVFTEGYEGKPFTRPNDLVRAGNGDVFFTDSAQNATPASGGPSVYRITAAGEVQRIAGDVPRPNGIVLSKDERTLFVANTLGQHVLAFARDADGSVGEAREFAALAGWNAADGSSGADGLAVDDAGRLYVASNAGIEVFDEDGAALGIIPLPVKPQNLAFAGPAKSWLYVVGSGNAYRLPVLTPGISSRAK